MACGCIEVEQTTDSNCPPCSDECPNGNINSECIVLSSIEDLTNLDITEGQGLNDALLAINEALDTTTVEQKVTISSTFVKLLFTSGYTLVSAPGSGKYIEVLGLSVKMEDGTIPYTVAAGNLIFKSTSATNNMFEVSDSVLATINTAIVSKPIPDSTGYDVMRVNEPLIIKHSSVNPLAGDGTLAVYITYIVKTV